MLDANKIIALLKSGASTVSIDCSGSDDKVFEELIARIAQPLDLQPFIWDAGDYLMRVDVIDQTAKEEAVNMGGSPDEPQVKKLLSWIRMECQSQLDRIKSQRNSRQNTPIKGHLIIIRDLFEFLNGPNGSVGYLRLAKKAFDAVLRSASKVIVLHNGEATPEALQECVIELVNPSPNEAEIRHVFKTTVEAMKASANRAGGNFVVELTQDDEDRIVRSLLGMTLARTAVCTQYVCRTLNGMNNGAIAVIRDWKRDAFKSRGIQYASPADVAPQGMDAVIHWARKRSALLKPSARQWNVDFPSGALLVGPPGTGKTLVSKALSVEWGLDTLNLPLGELFDKYQGVAEKRLREFLKAAEAMAPCGILIDEIDKIFSAAEGGESETSARILSTFLTWFSEKTAPVFVCATANRPWRLKPELIRRFSKVIYVPLPDQDTRARIFRVQLEERKIFLSNEEIEQLAFAANDFSGDEIRKVATEVAANALADGRTAPGRLLVTVDEILAETRATTAQARGNSEEIARLENWATNIRALYSNDTSFISRLGEIAPITPEAVKPKRTRAKAGAAS